MKKTAILLDAGFVKKRLYMLLGEKHCVASDIAAFVKKCIKDDEEIFRVYYYDCPPFEESIKNKFNIEPVAQFRRLTNLTSE